MNSLVEKSVNFNRKVKVNFEGGDLTSDAVLLLYREFDEKIGFSEAIRDILRVKDKAKQFQFINETLMNKVYSVEMPKQVLIDLDSTNCQTYGNQYGSNYNFHYSANGYIL